MCRTDFRTWGSQLLWLLGCEFLARAVCRTISHNVGISPSRSSSLDSIESLSWLQPLSLVTLNDPKPVEQPANYTMRDTEPRDTLTMYSHNRQSRDLSLALEAFWRSSHSKAHAIKKGEIRQSINGNIDKRKRAALQPAPTLSSKHRHIALSSRCDPHL